MKSFLILTAVLLSATFSHAVPRVGDTALYSVTFKSSGESMDMEAKLAEYNSQTQQFREVSTSFYPGYPATTEERWVHESDLISDAIINSVLADCAGNGGQDEAVTVIAGSFQTCKLPTTDGKGFVHVGNVPFGMIKADVSDNVSLQLKSFQFGP